MVGADRGGGVVRVHAVRLGDVVVLTHRADLLIVACFKIFFQAFGELKPVLKEVGKNLYINLTNKCNKLDF